MCSMKLCFIQSANTNQPVSRYNTGTHRKYLVLQVGGKMVGTCVFVASPLLAPNVVFFC